MLRKFSILFNALRRPFLGGGAQTVTEIRPEQAGPRACVEVCEMFRKYHVVLHSQMGPKSGTLTLSEDQGAVTGTLASSPTSSPSAGDARRMALHLSHRS
jgi:hypothetical protein